MLIDYVKCWQNNKNGAMMLVIPKPFRQKLKIKNGSYFKIQIINGKLVYEQQRSTREGKHE